MSVAEIGLLPEVDRVLRDEFPGVEIRLSSDYSPVLAKALMRRKLDAAFIRPEEQMGDLSYKPVRTDLLLFCFSERAPVSFASGHRAARGRGRKLLSYV